MASPAKSGSDNGHGSAGDVGAAVRTAEGRGLAPTRAVELGTARGTGPCPVCGKPLFGWLEVSDAERGGELVVDRCEGCGVGVTRAADGPRREGRIPEPSARSLERLEASVVLWDTLQAEEGPDAALAAAAGRLDPNGRLVLVLPNRASLQAGLGADWFHLDPARNRLHFTPRSLGLLLERHGLRTTRVRRFLAPGAFAGMWHSVMNAITFHPNFVRRVRSGSLTSTAARSRLTFALDGVITVLAAAPVTVLAALLEAAAGVARRGGTMVVVAERRESD